MRQTKSAILFKDPKSLLIIKPPYIWDTRAPFSTFIHCHKVEAQQYWVNILSLNLLRLQGEQQQRESEDARVLFKQFGMFWELYRKSYGKVSVKKEAEYITPTASNLLQNLKQVESHLTEFAIVSHFGAFEQFMNCWAINMLLTKIEQAEKKGHNIYWSNELEKLYQGYYPNGKVPTIANILRAFPEAEYDLKRLPHPYLNPETKEELSEVLKPNVNAYKAITFWREWRNLFVHYQGVIQKGFYDKHISFWESLRSDYNTLPKLRLNERIKLDFPIYRTYTATIYKSAHALRDILCNESNERRGHVLAPGKQAPKGKMDSEFFPKIKPPLLMEGDHLPSFFHKNQHS